MSTHKRLGTLSRAVKTPEHRQTRMARQHPTANGDGKAKDCPALKGMSALDFEAIASAGPAESAPYSNALCAPVRAGSPPPRPEPRRHCEWVNSPLYYGDYLESTSCSPRRRSSRPPRAFPRTTSTFIVIHQAYELWFKQILHEIDSIIRMMSAERLEERHVHRRAARARRGDSEGARVAALHPRDDDPSGLSSTSATTCSPRRGSSRSSSASSRSSSGSCAAAASSTGTGASAPTSTSSTASAERPRRGPRCARWWTAACAHVFSPSATLTSGGTTRRPWRRCSPRTSTTSGPTRMGRSRRRASSSRSSSAARALLLALRRGRARGLKSKGERSVVPRAGGAPHLQVTRGGARAVLPRMISRLLDIDEPDQVAEQALVMVHRMLGIKMGTGEARLPLPQGHGRAAPHLPGLSTSRRSSSRASRCRASRATCGC